MARLRQIGEVGDGIVACICKVDVSSVLNNMLAAYIDNMSKTRYESVVRFKVYVSFSQKFAELS